MDWTINSGDKNMTATKETSQVDKEMDGIRKVAILLLSLPEQAAAQLLSRLDRATVEDVTKQIAAVGQVSTEDCNQVVQEFYNMALEQKRAGGSGLGLAKSLLEKAMPKEDADQILTRIEHVANGTPFDFLQRTDSENLLTFIQDEHPQTIALILSHLPSSKASEVLAGLGPNRQLEVISRICHMEQTSPEVIGEVERELKSRFSTISCQKFEEIGGVETAAEMLNLVDRTTEKAILEQMEVQDPELADNICRLMFMFEDILLVDDKGIQGLLKEIDNQDLALALKTASEALKEKIFSNMSERASNLIKEEMEYMGPVRLSDVERAQRKIVDVVRRLDDEGEILIDGRGHERDMIV